jgi:hypothetical protein
MFKAQKTFLYHIVVVLGFGAVWICKVDANVLVNMLSPSSWAEMTRQGSRGLI